jgi:hypothetical protein
LLLLFDFFIGFDFASLNLLRGDNGVYLVRPGEGNSAGHISLKADIETDNGTVTKKYDVSLYPYARKGGPASGSSGSLFGSNDNADAGAMSEDELLAYEMRSVIGSLNDDQSAKRVSLPEHLRTGEKVTWTSERKNNTAVIAFGMILLAVIIYVRRLDPLEKIRLQQQDSVRRQLPEFINRLVLLLGAGLVLSTAFEKIVEENLEANGRSSNEWQSDQRQSDERKEDYFYQCMGDIYARIKETNGSLAKEFRAFARSGLGLGEGDRELMRISNIISDNISKGVELADKLQSESEMLWLSRKRSSEERGRLAETKLTLPLTVFLLVLVVVTVSPALLEL